MAESGDEIVCIMFTDLVGWTELGDRIGDDAADGVRRRHFVAIREALAAHRGREVKTAGDSVLATFRSARDALTCAVEVQNRVMSGDPLVRVGVHAGEPILDDDDVFGTAVNIASRLCSAAGPGEILASEVTRSLLGRRGAFIFDEVGPLELKGIADPLRAFRVRLGTSSVTSPVLQLGSALRNDAPAPRDFQPVPALLCPVLIGRGREVDLLVSRAEDAAAGHGGVAALVGAAGVGKTRLSREVTDAARRGAMTLLIGRAVPGETPVSYRPLTEAMLGAFRSATPPDAPELAGFEGQLGRLVPDWHIGRGGGADESPILLGEAVVRLLRILGPDHGCVLLLEDLHWADPETMSVVEYLADALRDEPTLCLCTSRPSGPAANLLARLRRRDGSTVIGLSPLDATDVERVVAACLDTDNPPWDVLAFIEAHSEGNPFLVEELLAGLAATAALRFDDGRWISDGELKPTVPFDFGDSIQRRLATLDLSTRRVVGAAAVLGRRFDWELLPGVAEVDGFAVVDGLRRAVEEQLVEVDGSEFKFRHALTREAVLGELLPPEHRALAQRALPAVERAHPGVPGPWCELAAELAEASGDPGAAAAYLVESASRAFAGGAYATAEATATSAARLAGDDAAARIDADEVLVQILALAGKPEQATARGGALVDRMGALAVPVERVANLLVVLARAALAGGDPASAEGYARQARQLTGQGVIDESVAARVEAVAAHVALEQGRLEEAEALARSAESLAARTGQPAVQCEAMEAIGRIVGIESYEGNEWFERAAELAERSGLTGWLLRARHELALTEWGVKGRVEVLRVTRDLAARHGALVTVAVMDLSLADSALASFDRDGCLEAAQRCVEASHRFGLATLPVAYLWLAGAHALAGDDAAMEAAAGQALEDDPADPRILGDLWGRVRATRSMVRDDRTQLRADLDTMMEYVRVAPVSTSIFPNRIIWSLLRTAEDDDRGEPARAELAGAVNLQWWPLFPVIQEAIGIVAEGRDRPSGELASRFAEASRQLHAYPAFSGSIHFFHVVAAEAAIRDGWGEPIPWLRRAEAFFSEAGYDLIARHCRRLLGDAGAPAPRRRQGDARIPLGLRAFGVTSRELDVLALVSAGLSNREIGERLFVSPKTVDRHLANLFDRIGVRDRRALADFARKHGIADG